MTKNTYKFIQIGLLVLLILGVIVVYRYIPIYQTELYEKNTIGSIIDDNFEFDRTNHKKKTEHNHITSIISNQDYNESKETNHQNKTNTKQLNSDIDCIVKIPEIDLEKFVYTGKNRETHLDNYEFVTACSDMQYCKGGNYVICGHASRLYGHSLNRIKELKKGMGIYIYTLDGKMDEYNVYKIYYESMNKTNAYCKQSTEQIITIISCARYVSEDSYIIIKAKKKDN